MANSDNGCILGSFVLFCFAVLTLVARVTYPGTGFRYGSSNSWFHVVLKTLQSTFFVRYYSISIVRHALLKTPSPHVARRVLQMHVNYRTYLRTRSRTQDGEVRELVPKAFVCCNFLESYFSTHHSPYPPRGGYCTTSSASLFRY
jgi:hypothetical protein